MGFIGVMELQSLDTALRFTCIAVISVQIGEPGGKLNALKHKRILQFNKFIIKNFFVT